MNRYERMLVGKSKAKRRIANKWYYGGGNACSWDRIQQRYPDAKYWKDWHFSGIRRYAGDCTEGVIRSRYRSSLLVNLNDDDIGMTFGGRCFDELQSSPYWRSAGCPESNRRRKVSVRLDLIQRAEGKP